MTEVVRFVHNPPLLGARLRGSWKAQLIFSLAVQPPLKHAVLEGPRTLPCMTHICQRSPPWMRSCLSAAPQNLRIWRFG
jgi:hypothetical protein